MDRPHGLTIIGLAIMGLFVYPLVLFHDWYKSRKPRANLEQKLWRHLLQQKG